MRKKIIAMIPARYESTRFAHKLMQVLDGKTIIARTYEAVKNSTLFDEVYVVCNHSVIKNEIEHIGGKVIVSGKEHESGSDRIAEAVENIDCDIIINIQGDEPFISKENLEKVIAIFDNKEVKVASLMTKIFDVQKIQNPNCVKVVCDKNNRALYFSRAAIPFSRDENISHFAYQHIGIYGFTKETLLHFTSLPPSNLEKIEKLENLRMLENNIDIYLAEVDAVGISIDTKEDFEEAKKHIELQKQKNELK